MPAQSSAPQPPPATAPAPASFPRAVMHCDAEGWEDLLPIIYQRKKTLSRTFHYIAVAGGDTLHRYAALTETTGKDDEHLRGYHGASRWRLRHLRCYRCCAYAGHGSPYRDVAVPQLFSPSGEGGPVNRAEWRFNTADPNAFVPATLLAPDGRYVRPVRFFVRAPCTSGVARRAYLPGLCCRATVTRCVARLVKALVNSPTTR